MQNRFVTLKVMLITFMAIALIAIPTLTQADVSKFVQKVTGDSQSKASSLTKNSEDTNKLKKPVLYQRSNYAWLYASGPYYGDVSADLINSPYMLKTLVGSFDTRSGVFNIPGELRKGIMLTAQNAAQYFIVQFSPDAFDNGRFETITRAEFESMGVKFFDYVPNRGFIVLLTTANYQMIASSSKVQYLEPYHPAFKIAPNVGQNALPDPVAAISPIYELRVEVFQDEPAIAVAQTISQLGGMVKSVFGNMIYVSIDRSKLGALAGIEAVKLISEDVPMFVRGEETTTTMQKGDYYNGSVPYFDVGVDGGGGGIAADCQYIQVIDSGASYDAGDLSNTSSDPGYPADPTVPNATHRKIYLYKTTGTGLGDLLSCDGLLSGSYSHGHVVSATALGNASDVPAGYGTPYYFYDQSSNRWKIDGVAKGAKLLFYDGYVTPVSGFCDEVIASGTLYSGGSGNLVDAYNNKARTANASWGSTTDKTYAGQPVEIDNFLFDKKDAMMFIAAGNEGSDTNQDNVPDPGTLYSPGNSKSALVIGMTYNANGTSGYNPHVRVAESSCGPVGSSLKPRVAPQLMAPGDDPYGAGSNMGIDSEYSCRSQDNDQIGGVVCTQNSGNTGTSFASPAAAGSSALLRDYFAQGFYPDGTSSNATNNNDKIASISGALVKAILIASADFLDGGNVYAKYRFNSEQGYGRIQLNNVLPLVTDPSTPLGLVVDDQGLSTGTGIAPNTSVTYNIVVTDNSQPLRVGLAWIEASGEDLANNLDMELYFDTDSDGTQDSGEPLYWGNFFNEDSSGDGTFQSATEDADLDGSMDQSQWSIFIKDTARAVRETYNPTEGIVVNNDQNGDGTLDLPTGNWTLKIYASAGNPVTQKYAFAMSGGVVLGSSIRFDKNPLVCNDIVHLYVNEKSESGDTSPTATDVKNRTTVYVKTVGPDGKIDTGDDVLIDTETGITFMQEGTALRFKSIDLPVSDSSTQANNNGILDLQDGYFLKAVYADTTATRFSLTTIDCSIRLEGGLTFSGQWGRDYAYLIDGGCETNWLGRSQPDKYMDQDEKLVYWIGILNGEGDTDLIDLDVNLRAVVPDSNNDTDPGRLDNATSPYVHIMNSPKVVGMLAAASAMGIPFDVYVDGNAPFPTKVEMVLGVKARKSGKTVSSYQAFLHMVNADNEVYRYSTDFPTGGTVYRDYNNDEKIDTTRWLDKQAGQLDAPGEDWDLWYEAVQFDDMTVTTYGGGNPGFSTPWNFNTSRQDFRSGVQKGSTDGASPIAQWGEDKNYNDVLDPGEDRDSADGTLNQAWGVGGGCGFQTNAAGQTTQGGAWHSGRIFNYGSKYCQVPKNPGDAYDCQPYETRSGQKGLESWTEFLKTPIINKVHVNNDANGLSYYVEFHNRALSWNQQMDFNDDLTLFTYEVDTDTDSDTAIDLADNTVLGLLGGPYGLKTAKGNPPLTDGYTVFAPSNSSGNQTNGTKGNSRVGKRGCVFESTSTSEPLGLARPKDDDIDNDSDGTIDEYVTANGPWKNATSAWPFNNGLPDWAPLEDVYGDSGQHFQAAFGFMVSEGTAKDQPPGSGYGVGIDDVEMEWNEMHPVADAVNCATTGQCASLSIKTINMFEGLTLVPVTVLDGNAQTTQAAMPSFDKKNPTSIDYEDHDGDGTNELKVFAYSPAEPDGEYFWLDQNGTGGFEYTGNIPVSSSFNAPGVIFVKNDGVESPTINIRYVDKNDGVHTYSLGADGKPGVANTDDDKYGIDGKPGAAGVDDDADGTIDEANEWCPTGQPFGDDDCSGQIDEADEHCPIGGGFIMRPYGDDTCGCPNNALEWGSSIYYPVGRMAVELVSQVSDNGDNDGYADASETVTIDITIKNLSRDDAGEFRALTGVVATLSSTDPDVACILDATASYGDIAKTGSKTNPADDRFQFQVSPSVTRASIYADVDAEFLLTISSNEFSGTYNPLKIMIPLDLDLTAGSGLTNWTESFEGGLGKFEVGRFAYADGNRCQYNDPNNPMSNSYGLSATECGIDSIQPNQDWHIHGTTSPDSGRAYDGTQSLHWGKHVNATNAAYDATSFQEMNYARTAQLINLSTSHPVLHYKTQCSLLDYHSVGPGGVGTNADRGVVMVARTDATGTVQGNWVKIYPYANVYTTQPYDFYVNCTFDPTDDGNTEDNFFANDYRHGPSSTCYPEFAFTHLGNTDYEQSAAKFDATMLGDGDGPGLQGSLGPGTWVESYFSLERFKGYQIKFRFLTTTINLFPVQDTAQWGIFDWWGDDGWYIDQVQVDNTWTNGGTIKLDVYANPTPTCPTVPSDNCDYITPSAKCDSDGLDNDHDGTIDEAGENNCLTPAPGHMVTMNAAGSQANKCVSGTLQYQWWKDLDSDGTLDATDQMVYDWCDKNYYIDSPAVDTWYFAKVRCSSDTACEATASVFIDVYTGVLIPARVSGLAFLAKNKTTFGWLGAVNATLYDTVKGDLKLLRSSKGDFTSSLTYPCLDNDGVDLQSTDSNTPAANGDGFYYLVRGANATLNGTYNVCDSGDSTPYCSKQMGDRDAEIAASSNKCP